MKLQQSRKKDASKGASFLFSAYAILAMPTRASFRYGYRLPMANFLTVIWLIDGF